MQLIISGRGVVLSRAVKTLLGQKVVKLARLLPHVVEARVTCRAEKFRHTVRLHLRAKRRIFSSVATADHLIAAADLALGALRRQVREDKERRRGLRLRQARRTA